MDMRNPIDILCKNCEHTFWYHNRDSVGFTWYCAFGKDCLCNSYEPVPPLGTPGNEIVVQYDNMSYKYN